MGSHVQRKEWMSWDLCLHRLRTISDTRVTTHRRSDARRINEASRRHAPAGSHPSIYFSCFEGLSFPDSRNFLSIQTKNRRGTSFLGQAGNVARRPHEKDGVHMTTTTCYLMSGAGRIAGWGLVRTHAAGAACVLPRPATPRPLGALLLAAGAPPDAGLLGATASRTPATEDARAIS
jgi:hypothetical protein